MHMFSINCTCKLFLFVRFPYREASVVVVHLSTSDRRCGPVFTTLFHTRSHPIVLPVV